MVETPCKLALIEFDLPDFDTKIKARISKGTDGESWSATITKSIEMCLTRYKVDFSIEQCDISVLDGHSNEFKELEGVSHEVDSFGRLLRIYVQASTSSQRVPTKHPVKAITGRYYDFDGKFTVGDHQLVISERPNQINSGTGLNVWDGAILLAHFLLENSNLVRGKVVLELGSGCGLVGLVAATLQARTVILSDLEYALEGLNANASANRESVNFCERIECLEIDWFNPPSPSDLRGKDGDGIDVILVADCVWMEDLVSPLLNTMDKLSDKNTQVLICYQRRGKSTHTAFWSGLLQIFASVVVQPVKAIPVPDVLFVLQCSKKPHRASVSN